MDEKTESLRDLFLDVAEDGTVTESQEAGPGSLADVDEGEVDERLADIVERMADRYPFRTSLDVDALVTLVRAFYADQADATIADDLGVAEEELRAARLDLHLLREDDFEAPFDIAALRRRLADSDAEVDDEALAVEFDTDRETVARHRRAVEAQQAARQVSHRFQSEFEDVLTEAGLATQHTAALRDDGLDEATEDIDSLDSDANVSM